MSVKEKANAGIDWSGCEVNPRKVSGVPIIKSTRVQADSLVENHRGGSPVEEISDNFSIPIDYVRQILAYAARIRERIRRCESNLEDSQNVPPALTSLLAAM
jgi:uncharacterized protein (DUF433 family)